MQYALWKQEKETKEDLQQALDDVQTLTGLLPICAQCKKIRDSEGYWNHVESYFERHSSARFSHSVCESCQEDLYGDQQWFQRQKKKKGTDLEASSGQAKKS